MASRSSLFVRPNGMNSMWVTMCLLFLFLLNAQSIKAEPAFQFHTLDKQQGLASSVVYDIAQDADGFMWFATEDGLQKYDGYEFTSYRHSRLDKNSLSNNVVRSLLIDTEDRLWVGTDGGVNLYQKEYDNFDHIYLAKDDLSISEPRQIQQSNKIRALYQSSDGSIWVGSGFGLSRIHSRDLSIKNYSQKKVRSIFEDDHKQLWIGTLGGGLYLFNAIHSEFSPIEEFVNTNGLRSINSSMAESNIIDFIISILMHR